MRKMIRIKRRSPALKVQGQSIIWPDISMNMMKEVVQVTFRRFGKILTELDSTNEQDQKNGAWGNLKSLIVPHRTQRRNSQLIRPLDIIKDDVVRQAQYSGKEYNIKARPRSYLLSIIAIQAVAGPYPQISKIFEAALVR